VGDAVILNLFYEFSALCTSIVAQTDDGKILHARNLDFGFGTAFTQDLRNLTIQVEFQCNGQTVYTGSTFAGYVGLLTGMRNDRFSISVNQRFDSDILGNLREILEDPNAAIISFLIRDVLEKGSSFPDALNTFVTHDLIAPVYLTMGGVKPGEGAVITRARNYTMDLWQLNVSSAPSEWYLCQTNYPHWQPDPWWDSRRIPCNEGMNSMGRDNLSLQGMYQVLSIPPVLNAQTTYSALISAGHHDYDTYSRTCPDPCPILTTTPPQSL